MPMEIQQILALLKAVYTWTLYSLGGAFMVALILDPIMDWKKFEWIRPLVPESHRLLAVIDTSFNVIKE